MSQIILKLECDVLMSRKRPMWAQWLDTILLRSSFYIIIFSFCPVTSLLQVTLERPLPIPPDHLRLQVITLPPSLAARSEKAQNITEKASHSMCCSLSLLSPFSMFMDRNLVHSFWWLHSGPHNENTLVRLTTPLGIQINSQIFYHQSANLKHGLIGISLSPLWEDFSKKIIPGS